MIRSRRLALVALVVTFGIAACGDPGTTAPAAKQPPVIHLASGTARDTAEMAPAAATAGAADSKIAAFGQTEFVYDGQLPDLTGPAASWFFAPGQQPDLDRVAKLAASFGVTGDVRTVSPAQGGGWAVGPEDYSGPVLTVGSDGMLSWWLSAQGAVVSSSGCAVVGASTTPAAGSGDAATSGVATDAAAPIDTAVVSTTPDIPVPDCPAPQPPAGVPTKDEALAKAKELFASWGYDLNSYTFDEPYADEWSASVNAYLTLDGMKAPITLSVGFGENATVTWASGTLATPQRGADYPTVGAAAGLERLKAQQNQYVGMSDTGVMRASTQGGAPDTAVAPDIATPPPAAPEAVAGTAAAGTGIAAPGVGAVAPDIAPCATDMNVPCGGPISTDPVTVTLNSVKNDLTMVWDTDQTVWLLPAYTFGSADGGVYTVLAVADSFIQQPVAEPATVPATGAPSTAEIPPGVATGGVAGNVTVSTAPAP